MVWAATQTNICSAVAREVGDTISPATPYSREPLSETKPSLPVVNGETNKAGELGELRHRGR